MTNGRWWAALVTFERRVEGEHSILPDWALGACGWMIALASDEDRARELLIRDVEHHSLRVVEIENEQEVFSQAEITEIDDHLASNFRAVEPGSRTVWGTIHCYKGVGEA